jgi:hypothetical protein
MLFFAFPVGGIRDAQKSRFVTRRDVCKTERQLDKARGKDTAGAGTKSACDKGKAFMPSFVLGLYTLAVPAWNGM